MKVIGIVCEYNPFHNGHLYQINKIKEEYKDSLIIVVSTSHFTERGEISILNKWEKAEIALKNKVDLFIELPYAFSVQSADKFAYGSIRTLNELKIEALVFGCEKDNLDTLKEVAKVQINNKKCDTLTKKYLDEGNNYPTSLSKAIKDLTGIVVNEPNELLAVSYIKEIMKLNNNIDIKLIKRTNSYHDIESNLSIVSAGNIRNKMINNIDIKKFVPSYTYKFLKNKKIDNNKYFELLKYKILTEKDLTIYLDVDEGIENRLKSKIKISKSTEEFIDLVKTKRMTRNKISRMLNHILIGFTKKDTAKFSKIEYVRILGMSKKGRLYLNSIKKHINVPVISKFKKEIELLNLELKVTSVYSILINDNTILDSEYKNSPIIIK